MYYLFNTNSIRVITILVILRKCFLYSDFSIQNKKNFAIKHSPILRSFASVSMYVFEKQNVFFEID